MTFIPQPIPNSVLLVSDLATTAAITADGKIVSVAGAFAIGDAGAAQYVYHTTGRSHVNISLGAPFLRVAGAKTDDWFELLDFVHHRIPLESSGNQSAKLMAATSSVVYLPSGEFNTSKVVINNAVKRIYGAGTKLTAINNLERIFDINGTTAKLHGCEYHGITTSQPDTAGSDNNHGSLTFHGVDHGLMIGNFADDVTCAFRVAYGPSLTGSRVGGEHNVLVGLRGNQVERIGVEVLGSRNTAVAAVSIQGDQAKFSNKGGAGYVPSYALRSAGYETSRDAKAWGNVFVGCTASEIYTLLTYQNACWGASAAGCSVVDCGIACYILSGVTDNETPQFNHAQFIAINCDRAIYNIEGSYSDYHVIATNIQEAAIEDKANPVNGAFGHNRFSGVLHDGSSHALRLRFPAPVLDISAIDFPTGVGCSLLAGSNWASGRVLVDGCQNGVMVGSNYCNLQASSRGGTFTHIIATGNSNHITGVTDTKLDMDGNDCSFIGVVTGQADLDGNENVAVLNAKGQVVIAGGLNNVMGHVGQGVVSSSDNMLSAVQTGIARCAWITPPPNSGALRQNNVVDVIGKSVERAVFNDEGNYNSFRISVDGMTGHAVTEESLPDHGGQGGNSYEGVIRNGTGDGLRLRYPYASLGMRVFGFPSGSGCIIESTANYARGFLIIDTASTGVILSASYCNLDLTVTNITNTAISVTGSNNVLRIVCDKPVVVSGSNNYITGNVDSINVTGDNNKFSVVSANPIINTGTGNEVL